MKKELAKITREMYYYDGGIKIMGVPEGITGDLTGIRGDLTCIRGNFTDITGDISGIRGDLTRIRGDLTGITGDLDDCEITEDDRVKGINIMDLVRDA